MCEGIKHRVNPLLENFFEDSISIRFTYGQQLNSSKLGEPGIDKTRELLEGHPCLITTAEDGISGTMG